MEDILQILPVLLFVAFIVFGQLSKVKQSKSEDYDFDNHVDVPKEKPVRIKRKQPQVIIEELNDNSQQNNELELETSGFLDETDWKKAIIYSEILKPKFEE